MNLRSAPAAIDASTISAALDLRDAPHTIARTLIERWLPAFYHDRFDRDPFEIVVPERGSASD
jgi:hypothetical protein